MVRARGLGIFILASALVLTAIVSFVPSSSVDESASCPAAGNIAAEGTYTVVFNSNDGTETFYYQSMHIGQTAVLSENKFVNDGFDFRGWSTSEDGPVSYSDRQSVSDLADADGSTVELYAVWGHAESGIPSWATNLCVIVVGLLIVFAVVYSRFC